jgi:AraC-like DNA-binding protein
LLHLLPAAASLVVSVVYYVGMTEQQIVADMERMLHGVDNTPTIFNWILLTCQFLVYFFVMFRYVYQRRKFLRDNYADSDYVKTQWIPAFLWAFFLLFLAQPIAYAINPSVAIWLDPIVFAMGMAYLIYSVMYYSTTAYINRLPDVPAELPKSANGNGTTAPTMNESQMKDICDRVTEYLQTSKAYISPDFSINTLSIETGIHHRSISTAINGYMHRNFFDLVNEMRIEEAKRLLLNLNSDYTTDSVYPECGFRSRSAFFAAFRKFAGATPTQWVKKNS